MRKEDLNAEELEQLANWYEDRSEEAKDVNVGEMLMLRRFELMRQVRARKREEEAELMLQALKGHNQQGEG